MKINNNFGKNTCMFSVTMQKKDLKTIILTNFIVLALIFGRLFAICNVAIFINCSNCKFFI